MCHSGEVSNPRDICHSIITITMQNKSAMNFAIGLHIFFRMDHICEI